MSVGREYFGQYATDVLTDEAVRVIQGHHGVKEQPLFLYLAHLAVHSGNKYSPLQAPPEIVEKFSHIEDEQRRIFAGECTNL